MPSTIVCEAGPRISAYAGLGGTVDWRALIVLSLLALKERGMTEAALTVDTDNLTGALRLYESVGFKPIKRFSLYQKPLVDVQ